MPDGFEFTFKILDSFFDRKAVIDALDKGRRLALSKAGAFIRTTAQRSMRRRKKISAPGTPPSAHEGSLRRLLYFGYDSSRQSVVVGPVKYRQGEAPALNEFGGRATRKDRKGHSVKMTYAPRPFMGPALVKETPNLPQAWQGVVKG